MVSVLYSRQINIPRGIKVKLLSRKLRITGPRGTLLRNFNHILVDIIIKKKLILKLWYGNKKKIASLNTITTLISNLITGVLAGFEYRMRLVYAHFPINIMVTTNKKTIQIRNFLGEKRIRKVDIPSDIKCIKNEKIKDEILIRGIDIISVSILAANIHRACLVKHKDIRKFLDGIYVYKINIIK